MHYLPVKSKGHICISTEREVLICIILNKQSGQSITMKIYLHLVELCNLSVFINMNGNSRVGLAFNALSSHLFTWGVGFVLDGNNFNALRSLIA